jgi:hypothetical protein
VLGLDAHAASSFRFFQRRTPEISRSPGQYQLDVLQAHLDRAFSGSVGEFVHGTNYQFVLHTSHNVESSSSPMNEAMAIYTIMYFLSSLVRYHPDYLDQISESTESWLIESFTKSAPLALLRYMTCYVLGYTLVMQLV